MNVEFFTTSRVAGLLMLLSIMIMLGAVVLIAAQGRLGGMAAAFRGVHPGSGDATGLRTIARFAVPFTMAQLAGFALSEAVFEFLKTNVDVEVLKFLKNLLLFLRGERP